MNGEEWEDFFSQENKEAISLAVLRILSGCGIDGISTCPQSKKRRSGKGALFGTGLEDDQERAVLECSGRPCFLPRVFVEALKFLNDHQSCEGLFRKSGSVSRQKMLRQSLVEAPSQGIPPYATPHDVAVLLRQYLRELPDLLLTDRFSSVFVDAAAVNGKEERVKCVLLTTILLPTQHLLCTQALMLFLQKVSAHSAESLMDSNNLALVMMPNLMRLPEPGGRKGASAPPPNLEKLTEVVRILIDHAHLIARVPPDVIHEASTLAFDFKSCSRKQKRDHSRRRLGRRESMAGLLLGTLHKWKNRRRNSHTHIDSPNSTDFEDSPGPSASKRMALEEEEECLISGSKMSKSWKVSSKLSRRHSERHGHTYKKSPLAISHPIQSSMAEPSPSLANGSFPLAQPSPVQTCGKCSLGHSWASPVRLLSKTPATPQFPSSFGSWAHPVQHRPTVVQMLDPPAPALKTFCGSNPADQENVGVDTRQAGEGGRPQVDVVSEVVCLKFGCQSDTGSDAEPSADDDGPHMQRAPNIHAMPGSPRRNDTAMQDASSIAARVRKRRQSERESCGLAQSFSMVPLPRPFLPATPTISVSQSDYFVGGGGKSVRTRTPASQRKTKQVRRKTPKSSGRRPRKMKVLASPSSTEAQTPSLLHEVSAEITERYRYTPSQLAPSSNNQSYLFAVREAENTAKTSKEPLTCTDSVGGDLCGPPLHTVPESPQVLRSLSNQLETWTPTDTALNTNCKTPAPVWTKPPLGKTLPITPQSFRLRREAARNKLSKNAKKYIVSNKPQESTSRTPLPAVHSPMVKNKRGIQISEWII